ncbi:MAG TPA: hypothetical protein DCS97_13655, partial [Planctomycetes bacterium]|nr:hypothetical protein [Planctomycetota bacterium]
LLAEANTDLCSVTENIDTTTPSGRLFFHMLASFNEYDRDNIRERIKAAMTHLRAQGFWTGGHVPPGCQLVAAGERRKLVEDPAVAPLVRPLWSWILAGDGLNVSARRLQDAGVPAPGYVGLASRRGWTPSQAWNLVRSPQVTGILVDAATQAAAIQALAGRKTPVRRGSTPKPGARASVASIVAGLLRCPMCGSSMVQATVKQKYRYFRCCLANKNRSLCRQKDPRVELVEAAVVDALEEAINGGRYRDSLLAAKHVSIGQVQEARQAKGRLTVEREQLAGRIAHLARTGQVGTAGFNAALEALGEDAKAIDRRLVEAEAILAVRGVDADNIELALDTIGRAMARFQAADCSPVERAAILREWIQKVEVHPDRVRLFMWGMPENKEPQPFGRGFAPETGIGTPKRTMCKPVLVEIPRGSPAAVRR